MEVFKNDNSQFQYFIDDMEKMKANLEGKAKEEDIKGLEIFIKNFKDKTADFYRENRKLNIGVVGQVKAGKSSFLNTLLFEGKEILPKASTPKTATLTKMEYSEQNIIQIEYYNEEEWEGLEDNAAIELEDEIYTSAREIMEMVRKNGIDPHQYLNQGTNQIHFDSYDDLLTHLNDYVGEDGRFTPIVKSVTLYLNKEEFKGLSIVDTPGLNDPIASRTIRTKEFIEVCDVVFFLSQSGSFLDKSDWNLLSSQLPQKGVKKLVLIASKYDSGVRDVLRVSDDDDIFGEDENTADNIPKACKIIKRKLKKRAKSKVAEFVTDLERRNATPELIKVIQQCSEPILVSSISYNMSNKSVEEYTAEEKNIYSALSQFSKDMKTDLKALGNFEEVKTIFSTVVEEKEKILKEKEKSFLPIAKEDLRCKLSAYKERSEARLSTLEKNDRAKLTEEKDKIQNQIGKIRFSISSVFGELNEKLEYEKLRGVREIRESSMDYQTIQEHSGTETKHGSYTTGHLWWKKRHDYTYEEHYSYYRVEDVLENLHDYSVEAQNHVEMVFTDTLKLKELKKKLFNVVIENFDMGSEKYDAALFRSVVEDTITDIELPIFELDISGDMDRITSKFSRELRSQEQKTELSAALLQAIRKISERLCESLQIEIGNFKRNMTAIEKTLENSLLENINKEFEILMTQCENKEREIEEYRSYIAVLESEIAKLR